jgi:2'-deoxynucleoside 5'-phosphate N-hydrolase
MNVYFACSITGGRQEEKIYQLIVAELLNLGYSVPTAHLSQSDVTEIENTADPKETYTRDIGWIQQAQALVAEVSTPSHGVGYEIAYALSLNKPVLCLAHESKPVSKMISGNTHPQLSLGIYKTPEEIQSILHLFFGSNRIKGRERL